MPASTHVLAVDDNRVHSYAIEKKLRTVGFPVKCVFNGSDALAEIKTGAYDVILLDVHLPDISGFDVCTSIRSDLSLRQPAIIFHSATHASEVAFRRAHALGADAFLTYPLESEALAAVLLRASAARRNGKPTQMLTCWKDIALFFGKGVRTVQRWEAFGMPVHRPGKDRNIVFADPNELERWAFQTKPHD